MAEIDITFPEVGLPNSSEDPKIVTAFSVIQDEINGGLDNSNIATGADISGDKLDDDSVTNAKIAADISGSKLLNTSVPGSKLESNTVGRGKTTFVLENVTGSSAAAGVQTVASISLAPGKYLAFWRFNFAGQVATVDTDGGTATLTDLPLIGSAGYEFNTMVSVTATATLRFRSEAASGTRSVMAYIVGMAD